MRTDEKDREGAEPGGAIGARLMEFALKARKVFVIGEVNEKLARDVVQQLHILASISDEPIHMFVNSPGGHVESGDMIFDAIRFITPKVIMIGSGSVASAGALIYAAADKENRYSLPNTRFLLHQPSGGIQGPASNIEIYRREIVRMKERLDRIFAEATGQTAEKISADTERDFWLNAEEAQAYGLVNRIIVSEREIVLPRD
ncbi:TPA: ATP-dependent Clp protease proteolytic subunit [Pseudomonas aeruginosa]|uniref:ATP-dependent Clp protease proteolytic subunit n=2 Tax=Pseudomonas aeruginosa group TaxID=136841 RepID=A0ABD7JUV0_PSEAI|nr:MULTISPECIES: ATP-dependent Clp protease proteolytic subunit [Pseudomonas aeruginosa group]KFF36181.1 Clp protease [Pseudomonas aeruginosa VRFPA01]ABR83808.1 putative Clp protease [Pseudomonas aeruginosa PA7]KSC51470.1 ATP-dependent Clp protease proteolytic subunit [Pseudomonas paraeruginosa]KSC90053.1 ATP-dependent Clp protease proteolytic subunit [Pseudomonas aeruginosa]KSD22633.1 ATP-dependent Clp protease proteolytic subunit [Pseudomonas aeruginosa]